MGKTKANKKGKENHERLFASLALCLAGAAAATSTAAANAAPYVLADTEVLDLHAATLQRDYQVYVALPESYGATQSTGRRYPVIFVVDANYGFPVVRAIADRLHKHGHLEEAIVVGLSYAKGDSPTYSRRRDYTPSVPRAGVYTSDMPGRQVAFGQADDYGRFISKQVFPLVAARYGADMGRKIFVGHSYGSLLGVELLLTRPGTFEDYILGSPSLWFDGGVLFERERAYARAHKDLPAKVYFGIGGQETLARGQKRSRSEEHADMVADLREFDAALKAHRYPGLKTQLEVFPGEDHASVFPILLTHGLRAYLHEEPR
ncbi:alpha/beta hydrolase [Massilia sp. 9096]|uniref:alpha/beta hydrolase n=1 Tax=Massilia sp. 9096 TaxID=1500894 RepID=UPI000690D604|nr:alpha/beta hydrolase-fold protein [Massilia sp. 9096]